MKKIFVFVLSLFFVFNLSSENKLTENMTSLITEAQSLASKAADSEFTANPMNLVKLRKDFDSLLLRCTQEIADNPPEFVIIYNDKVTALELSEEDYENLTISLSIEKMTVMQLSGKQNKIFAQKINEILKSVEQSSNWGEKINGFPKSYAADTAENNWYKILISNGEKAYVYNMTAELKNAAGIMAETPVQISISSDGKLGFNSSVTVETVFRGMSMEACSQALPVLILVPDSGCTLTACTRTAWDADHSTLMEDFVKITGGTVTGSASNAVWGASEDYYKGVFVEGRTVTISDFYMCDHEVTQGEYEAVIGKNPSHFKDYASNGEKQENRPVECVSWYDALVYCNKRSIAEGLTPCYSIRGTTDPDGWGDYNKSIWDAAVCNMSANGYRLPTEAEWEYAARGGSVTYGTAAWKNEYAGSDSTEFSKPSSDTALEAVGWYYSNSDGKTHEVMQKEPNALGLYDMSGNVWEWCWDWYGNIESGTERNPDGPSLGSSRVERGGSWGNIACHCAVSCRGIRDPGDAYDYLGFRLVRSAQ